MKSRKSQTKNFGEGYSTQTEKKGEKTSKFKASDKVSKRYFASSFIVYNNLEVLS
jgi:hypothetical protein